MSHDSPKKVPVTRLPEDRDWSIGFDEKYRGSVDVGPLFIRLKSKGSGQELKLPFCAYGNSLNLYYFEHKGRRVQFEWFV